MVPGEKQLGNLDSCIGTTLLSCVYISSLGDTWTAVNSIGSRFSRAAPHFANRSNHPPHFRYNARQQRQQQLHPIDTMADDEVSLASWNGSRSGTDGSPLPGRISPGASRGGLPPRPATPDRASPGWHARQVQRGSGTVLQCSHRCLGELRTAHLRSVWQLYVTLERIVDLTVDTRLGVQLTLFSPPR